MAVCSKCGKEVSETSVVCQNCGNVLKNPFDEVNKKFVQAGPSVLNNSGQSLQKVVQQPIEEKQNLEAQEQQEFIEVGNPVIKYAVLAIFLINISFFLGKIINSAKGMDLIIYTLYIVLLLILGCNKFKNMETSFKDGFLRLYFIIFILRILISIFNPVGFIKNLLSIKWWLGSIIFCFLLFIGYYITKKISIFITSKIESNNLVEFLIVDLGLILPLVQLVFRIISH